MRDVGTAVRKAIFTALNGNVSWEGAPVVIVDEKLDRFTEADLYILIDSQNELPVNVKTYFATTINLVLRVVNRRQSTNTKTIVENVSNQVLQLLKPSKTVNGISVEAPFYLSLFNVTDGVYQFEKLESGFQISKAITTSTRITHE